MFFYLLISYLSEATLIQCMIEELLTRNLYFHDNKVKLEYHYQVDKYMNMLRCLREPFMTAIYRLLVNL